MEDCSNLPTLQDMLVLDLINDDDEEFDANKLEELAESLLADITADMEASDRTCNETIAEIAGGGERLSGSVVGTTTECMESSEHSKINTDSISLEDERRQTATEITLPNKIELEENYIKNNQDTMPQHILLHHAPTNETKFSNFANNDDDDDDEDNTTPDTVYGTYDAMTNSIIVMEVGSAPVNEVVEEIYCDGIKPIAIDDIKCPTPAASPSQVYLNVDCSDDEDDLDFDPIAKFLCPKRPFVSPLSKSPALSLHSANSDHGYESIMGSPLTTLTTTVGDEAFDTIDDLNWNYNSFNDLFPTLI